MSLPKIGIIDSSIDVTGALKAMVNAAQSLSGSFQFVFIIPKYSRAKVWLTAQGFTHIYELPMRELNRSPLRMLSYLPVLLINTFTLRALVKKEKINLLHANDIYNLLPAALRLTACRIPYVSHIRFLPDRFPRPLFQFWLKTNLRFAKKIVVVSHAVMRQLPVHPKIIMIYDELIIAEHLTPVPANKQGKTFLYLANFMQGKGQNFALDAFARVTDQLPDWKLRFVGSDMGLEKNIAYRQSLQNRADQFHIHEKIEWEGFTADVETEYKRADIVLNFSESESFSFTCAEALFFGRPLIATDCGGPAEIIDSNETGLLVENRDVAAMAEAMLYLAKNETLRHVFSEQGNLRIREKFNSLTTSLRLKNIYEEALKEK